MLRFRKMLRAFLYKKINNVLIHKKSLFERTDPSLVYGVELELRLF